ncbi:MAG: xanthine dehydrogenase family protein [Candidatus Cloacimonetes bacterium]|nr:xanthine dehydrogenase family protein [Candidatus Cloacimonadota bacterium]
MKYAWRNDAFAKVTGRARYADDIKMPGLCHAVPVYADAVHARLLRIDPEAAGKSPGVLGVFTAADIPGTVKFGQIIRDCPTLAGDKIRCHGDVIALVVAETRAQAMVAGDLVKCEIEDLPALTDPEQALAPDAILIHAELGTNLVNEHSVRRGDVSAGETASEYIIAAEVTTSRIEHSYLEPEAAVALVRPDGVVEIHGSMQHPFSTRRFVASTLGLPLAQVEVTGTPMGGGFGGKDDTAALVCARAALCAWLLKRPVKITYTREWSMRESYKRHPYRMRYRMGLDAEGRIRFVYVDMLADGGAYCSVSPWVTWRSTVQCCGAYEVPNVHCDVRAVYTNNVFCGAMRGFGSPQVNFAIEQLIEIAGQKAGLDEITIRRRNMLQQDSVTVTGQQLSGHTVSLRQVMDRVLAEIDYVNKRQNCSFGDPEAEEWYGIGFAISYRGMSLGAEGTDFNSAIISIQPDGSVILETGIHENGQGSESAMILLAAEHLGIDKNRIVYRRSSTSTIPDGGTTVASRGTLMGGGAVVDACHIIQDKIGAIIRRKLAVDPAHLLFREGFIYDEASARRLCSFNEAIGWCYQMQEYPYAFGVFKAPQVSWDEHTGQGNAYFTWVYGCQAVELKVVPKTGQVVLLNMVAAHDIGNAVNPAMLSGQFYGGMAMGTGYALFEEFRHQDGKGISSNFHNYRIPRATDLPPMTAIIVENPDPLSPSGAKGIGEPTNELMAPAIANALYRATGKRYLKQPIQPDRRGAFPQRPKENLSTPELGDGSLPESDSTDRIKED